MTPDQVLNAITGVATLTMSVCLAFMLWRSRHVRAQLAGLLQPERRHIVVFLSASLWCVPVLMFLGSFKVLFYAGTSYTSPASVALTGATAGVAVVTAGMFVRNLIRLLAHDQ